MTTRARDSRHELAPLQMELREAMGQWGCPLCRLSQKAEHAFIASLSYERVLDLKTRDALKASRGLCAHHTRVWQRLQGSALGLAIVYRVSLLDLLRDTEPNVSPSRALFRRKGRGPDAAETLEPSGPCPACEIARGAVERFGGLLAKDIEDPEVQKLLRSAGGLCLPHLRDTLRLRGAGRHAGTLIRVHREAWGQLLGELEEFIRKNDYRFTHERMTPEEETSWSRALDVLVGLEGRQNQG